MLKRRRVRDSFMPWAWLALVAAVVYGTLHGAHLSGKRAAAEARRLLAEFRA